MLALIFFLWHNECIHKRWWNVGDKGGFMMKARITAGLTALAMLSSAMPMAALPVMTGITASAADYTEETYGDLTIHKYASYIEIAGCDKTVESVEIPATIDGLPVISIGSYAFSDHGSCQFKSITLPESIISIGQGAFEGCNKLEEIVLPDTVQEIGALTFRYCNSLKSVKLPKYLKAIPNMTFAECTNLTSIEIPATVTWIGQSAFYRSGLTSITIPENVQLDTYVFWSCTQLETAKIGKGVTLSMWCFYECKALTSVELPEDLETIPQKCFQDCESLTSVTIPDTVKEIGEAAFSNCTSLKEAKLSANLEKLVFTSFENCKSLEAIEIPGTVKTISQSSFSGCAALSSLTINEGVETIEFDAFNGCSGLTEVTLPASVRSVSAGNGHGAFMNCAKLQSVKILNPECNFYEGRGMFCNYTLNDTSYYTGVIYGYPGSTAQTYAEECSYHFEPLEAVLPGAGMGDLNEDNIVNASDAAQILIASAAAGAGGDYGLTEAQIAAADINKDGEVNASDAALILIYAAYVGSAESPVSLEEFLKTR